MVMIAIFFTSFVIGLAYCAAPGVINAEAIRRGLNHGFRSSLHFQLGGLAGDVLWAIITLSGIAMLRPSVETQLLMGIGGGLLMIWMACGILRKAWQTHAALAQPERDNDLLIGTLLTMANPFAILFWLSIGAGLMAEATYSPLVTVTTIICAFVVANLLWCLLLASVATYGRRIVRPNFFRWIDAGAGICIAICGVSLCWQTVASLMPFLT
jgi:threonine/homoserine/homoserine lactone efflux protein